MKIVNLSSQRMDFAKADGTLLSVLSGGSEVVNDSDMTEAVNLAERRGLIKIIPTKAATVKKSIKSPEETKESN